MKRPGSTRNADRPEHRDLKGVSMPTYDFTDTRPLCIDLFCGLGGWSEGFIAEGWRVVGFDNERHQYGDQRYPGQLVLQDVLTIHGSQFRNADCIVASPPCQKYSWMAMPWSLAKREVRWQEWERDSPFGDRLEPLNALFNACFRIQREASEAAGRHIPMVVENVKGAQKWVGRANWHHGSFYLWGDVPAIMPHTLKLRKVPGFNFHQHENGGAGGSFQSAAVAGIKGSVGIASGDAPEGTGNSSWFFGERADPRDVRKQSDGSWLLADGTKVGGSGAAWFDAGPAALSSRSSARKAASAMIAKIPGELSRYIARYYRPQIVPAMNPASANAALISGRFESREPRI
jgi:hypothetical protein